MSLVVLAQRLVLPAEVESVYALQMNFPPRVLPNALLYHPLAVGGVSPLEQVPHAKHVLLPVLPILKLWKYQLPGHSPRMHWRRGRKTL